MVKVLLGHKILLAALILFFAAQLPSFSQESAETPVLTMSASSPNQEVTIGDWINIDLLITNLAATNTNIIKPVIDIDSVSFRIKQSPLEGNERPWSFAYSQISPSVTEHKRDLLEKISLGISGTPEAQYKASYKLPAAAIANWEITVYYQGGPAILVSEALKVKISGPKTEAGVMKKGELVAKIDTSFGPMTCKFSFKDAPNTVMHFAKLAKEGFYNGQIFHRVIKGFMIQGGDPLGTGSGGPGYSIKSEVNANKHIKGALAMARSENMDSAGSQFYLCLDAKPHLDKDYTTFGKLIDGENVLDTIGNVNTTASGASPADRPLDSVTIKSVIVEFKEAENPRPNIFINPK